MIKRIILLSWFTVLVVMAHAQYVSRLGKFQVDQKKGCAPFTVTITNTNLLTTGECTALKPCNMDYEGKGQQQNLFTYTYTTPGTFKLSVLYQSTGSDDITITVDPNIKPDYEVYTCSSNRVSLKVTNKDYDQYVIDFGDGSPTLLVPISNNIIGPKQYSGSGNFSINVRGQNLNAAPNCTPMTTSFSALATLPAPRITTLTSVDATTIKLDFAIAANIQYRLEIGLNSSSSFQLYQTLYGLNTLSIPNLKLDENYYCFRLGAFDPCTGTSTYSPIICSHKFTLNVQSGVNKLSWISGTAGVSSIAIQRDAKPYTTIPGAPVLFDDKDVTCKVNYCYSVTNNYSNGSKSISLEKCGTSFANASPTRIENTTAIVNESGQLVDLAHHPHLMLLGLGTGGVVVEHDLGRGVGVLARPGPALHRGGDEPGHLVDEGRVPDEDRASRGLGLSPLFEPINQTSAKDGELMAVLAVALDGAQVHEQSTVQAEQVEGVARDEAAFAIPRGVAGMLQLMPVDGVDGPVP